MRVDETSQGESSGVGRRCVPVSRRVRDETTEREARAGSLKRVIDVIPAAYENPTWRGMGYFVRDSSLYLLAVVALIFVANSVADAVLAVTAFFVVRHDSAPEALFKSTRTNSLVGRVAMLPSWHVFAAWVPGINRFHRTSTVR